MIVWSGRGIFALLFPIIGFAISFVLGENIPLKGYEGVLIGVFTSLGGLLTWYLGSKWNKAEVYYDIQDQKYYKRENDHTLFWIPMQYVGIGITGLFTFSVISNNLWIGIVLTLIYVYIILYDFFKQKGLGFKKTKQRPMSKKEEEGSTPPKLPTNNSWESRDHK